jgi:hypothetical protein
MGAAHLWHGSPAARSALRRALATGWAPAPAWLPWLSGEPAGDAGSPGVVQGILPADAVVHITVAWGVGALMAYLSEWYRR